MFCENPAKPPPMSETPASVSPARIVEKSWAPIYNENSSVRRKSGRLGQITSKNGAPTRDRSHVKGESNREIARQEGIGRDMVGLILSQQEVVQKIAQCRTRLLDLVQQAIKCTVKR